MTQDPLHRLQERIKELTALHQTARILQRVDASPRDVIERIVNILPAAWQYPAVTEARIRFREWVAGHWRWLSLKYSLAVSDYFGLGPTQVNGGYWVNRTDGSLLADASCSPRGSPGSSAGHRARQLDPDRGKGRTCARSDLKRTDR